MGKLNNWTQQEDQILTTSFEKFKSRKWKNISQILSQKGYERSEAQCRQRYVNHLDPILDKNPDISEDQLQILYTKYEEYGPKWCVIQSFIPYRTQIKIKNVFYGNIRLFLKKLYKYFTKKTAVFINQLKTDDLQQIYDGKQGNQLIILTEFKGLSLIKKAFKKLHYKINQQNCIAIISKNQEDYFVLLSKILETKTKIRLLEKNNDQSHNQSLEKSFENNTNTKKVIKSIEKQSNQKSIVQNKRKDSVQAVIKDLEGTQSPSNYAHFESPFNYEIQAQYFLNFPLCSSYFFNRNLAPSNWVNSNPLFDNILQQNKWNLFGAQHYPMMNQITIESNKFLNNQQNY